MRTDPSVEPANLAFKPARTSIAPAIGLFFLAPLVAEFLLGNLSMKLLPALIVLAPLYGGGALLIRETVRRTRHGWPSIFLLGLAYAVFEEAFTTQSLFNLNYLGLGMGLLKPAYIPALGVGGWWTLWMLNVHAIWSIGTPIALIEATVPNRATEAWLGRAGCIVAGVLFAFGAVMTTLISVKHDHFTASPVQFASAALIAAVFVVLAFVMPRPRPARATGWTPSPWAIGALALAAGSAALLIPMGWGWWAAAALLILDVVVLISVLSWSRRAGWNLRHKLALASGAALAYAWHAFIQHPVTGGSLVTTRAGNAVFALAVIGLIRFAARRTAEARAGSVSPLADS